MMLLLENRESCFRIKRALWSLKYAELKKLSHVVKEDSNNKKLIQKEIDEIEILLKRIDLKLNDNIQTVKQAVI
jgi:hypothetical protein